jgi:hypothetical protein
MEAKLLFPFAVLSGVGGCYAAPTTAAVTTATFPFRSEAPFPENLPGLPPEQDHGPHGDEDPGQLLTVANSLAASGVVTNTTAAMLTTLCQTWTLSTSPVTYDKDAEFAKLFEKTGASVMLEVQDVHEEVDVGQASASIPFKIKA